MVAHNKKALAKSLYLDGQMTLAEISESSGINLNTLKYYVDKGSGQEMAWKNLRQVGKDNELLEILKSDSDASSISDIYSLGLSVVQRSLAKMELSGEELNVQGVDRLLSALDKIDRWKRLEQVKEEVDADNLVVTDVDKTMESFGHLFKKPEVA